MQIDLFLFWTVVLLPLVRHVVIILVSKSVLVLAILSLRGQFSWITFHVSSTFVYQFLLVALFIETSTTKSVFFWYQFQLDVHLFCRFTMTFIWTKNAEKTFNHDRELSGYRQNYVNLSQQLPTLSLLCVESESKLYSTGCTSLL